MMIQYIKSALLVWALFILVPLPWIDNKINQYVWEGFFGFSGLTVTIIKILTSIFILLVFVPSFRGLIISIFLRFKK